MEGVGEVWSAYRNRIKPKYHKSQAKHRKTAPSPKQRQQAKQFNRADRHPSANQASRSRKANPNALTSTKRLPFHLGKVARFRACRIRRG